MNMTTRTVITTVIAFVLGLSLMGCDPEKAEPVKATTPTADSATSTQAPVESLKEQPADGDEVAVLETDKGRIVLMFYPEKAPKHVENFKTLVKSGFYNGTRFHRCIPGFMIQGGDPNSKDIKKAATWGMGGNVQNGAEVTVPAEFNNIKHVRGTLSMARGGDPNSASSQFFIMHDAYPSLDGGYSAFGKAITGLEVVDEIVNTPLKDIENGGVFPTRAVVLKSATIETWPLK